MDLILNNNTDDHLILNKDGNKIDVECMLNTLWKQYALNGHDYVEIGGIKWATMNVGATAVTDNGLVFQWGDTQGYDRNQCGTGEGQKYFGWADYKYCSGAGTSSSAMTKYNDADGKLCLDIEDDGVRAAWADYGECQHQVSSLLLEKLLKGSG